MNGRFEYIRADDVATAVALVSADPAAHYLAGGTTQVDLLLKDGVLNPDRLVDITRLPLRGISRRGDVLLVGALTTMEELAADPGLGERAGSSAGSSATTESGRTMLLMPELPQECRCALDSCALTGCELLGGLPLSSSVHARS